MGAAAKDAGGGLVGGTWRGVLLAVGAVRKALQPGWGEAAGTA